MTSNVTSLPLKALVVASATVMVTTSLNAATETDTFTVDAEVTTPPTTCALTASNISFPPYDGTANVTASGVLDVDCSTLGLSVAIDLDGVTSGGGGDRNLDEDGAGTDTITYSIADPNNAGAKWGAGGEGNTVTHVIVDDSTNPALNQLAMDATILSGQSPTVGTYSQTITATATF